MKNEHGVVFHSIELENFEKVHEDQKLRALLVSNYKIQSTFIANLEGKLIISLLMVREPKNSTVPTIFLALITAISVSIAANLLIK